MLLDRHSLSRSYIERKGVEAVVTGHLKGDKNYTTELHKVLTLEILHRLFLDNPKTELDQLTATRRFVGAERAVPDEPVLRG